MQKCHCTVALRGDLTFQVLKKDLTVPEILLLMHAHGRAAVQEVPGTRSESNVEHAKEYARLTHTYGSADVSKLFGSSPYAVRFPTRLREVFPDADEPETADPAPEPVADAAAEGLPVPELAPEPEPEPEPEPAPKRTGFKAGK